MATLDGGRFQVNIFVLFEIQYRWCSGFLRRDVCVCMYRVCTRTSGADCTDCERVGEGDDETSFSYFDIAVITAATCKGVVVVGVCVCVLI